MVFAFVILSISGLLWAGISFELNSFTPFAVVSGVSMRPTLYAGDIVVLDAVPFNQLKVGDIIVFKAPIYNSVGGKCSTQIDRIPCYVIHRIVNITTSGKQELIKTKGDNNPTSENGVDCLVNVTVSQCQAAITQSDYVGKVVYRLPLLGVMAFAVARPYNYLLIMALIVVLVLTEYKS